jgi:hypothetical protein
LIDKNVEDALAELALMQMIPLAVVELSVTGSSVEEPTIFDMTHTKTFHR